MKGKKSLVFLCLLVLVIITYSYLDKSIGEKEAIEIASSYLEHEDPSFLLDHIYKIDTRKERISEEVSHFKGKVWYIKFTQNAEITAFFYLDADNGTLIKGYIIDRKGNIIKKFK